MSKIEILGAHDEQIFVEFSTQQLAGLGIDRAALIAALQAQNAVSPSGSLQTGDEKLLICVSGASALKTRPVFTRTSTAWRIGLDPSWRPSGGSAVCVSRPMSTTWLAQATIRVCRLVIAGRRGRIERMADLGSKASELRESYISDGSAATANQRNPFSMFRREVRP